MKEKIKCPKCGSSDVSILEIEKYDPGNIFGFTIMDYAKQPNRSCICSYQWRELQKATIRRKLKRKLET